jgi:hypothetical protein
MIPAAFVGAWERRSIALGDGAPHEPAAVVWVQGWSSYTDLRLPVAGSDEPVECFAGHTTWEEPHLRWGHDVDLAGGPAASTDVGSVEWDGDDLVERGTFIIDGVAVPYIEVWRKLSGSEGRVVEITDAGLVHVAVGNHELTVVDRRDQGLGFSAAYRVDGATVRSFGPPLDAEVVPA